ncbi:hypothetical protein EJ110_NYTH30050 [Nymphaea thermarum]|nr:hypothetical protein EJ110_NYTH30050 [Nymphaea thermarum]
MALSCANGEEDSEEHIFKSALTLPGLLLRQVLTVGGPPCPVEIKETIFNVCIHFPCSHLEDKRIGIQAVPPPPPSFTSALFFFFFIPQPPPFLIIIIFFFFFFSHSVLMSPRSSHFHSEHVWQAK